MKNLIKISISLVLLSALVGCASSPNIRLEESFWQDKQQTVAVAKTPAVKPKLVPRGGQGIADVVISQAANQKFTKYMKSMDTAWYSKLQNTFAAKLKANGIKETIDTKPIDAYKLPRAPQKDTKQYAKKDFHRLATQIGKDKLLLIDVKSYGAIRSYYGFIPLSAPAAFVSLEGQLVDLNTNKLFWRYSNTVEVSVEGKWDQPPTFPNFTQALNKAINKASDELMLSFFANRA